jgi:selenocysteine lyase/cysteine desulfurase
MTVASADPVRQLSQQQFRSLFPALERFAWFATPGVPPGAAPVADAVRHAVDEWQGGTFDWMDWERDAEAARRGFATLIGAAPASVALMATLAEAASTVAGSLLDRWSDGEIVVPAREFRSNVLPWDGLRERGFSIKRVELGPAHDWTSAILTGIGRRTRLVAMSEVQSATGVRADVPAILERCRDVGAELFLNGTQSLGVLRTRDWLADVDYVATHGYKWMLAPRGATWLYVRPDRLEAVNPIAPSWKSVTEPYADLYGRAPALAGTASKLDASLAWLPWCGARVAIEIVEAMPAAAEAHALSVANELRAALCSAGLAPIGEDAPSQIVSVVTPRAAELHDRLARADVAASVRDGCLRFGCHYFNTTHDVDRVANALAGAVA